MALIMLVFLPTAVVTSTKAADAPLRVLSRCRNGSLCTTSHVVRNFLKESYTIGRVAPDEEKGEPLGLVPSAKLRYTGTAPEQFNSKRLAALHSPRQRPWVVVTTWQKEF